MKLPALCVVQTCLPLGFAPLLNQIPKAADRSPQRLIVELLVWRRHRGRLTRIRCRANDLCGRRRLVESFHACPSGIADGTAASKNAFDEVASQPGRTTDDAMPFLLPRGRRRSRPLASTAMIAQTCG